MSVSRSIVETVFATGGLNKVNKQLVLSAFVVSCVGKNGSFSTHRSHVKLANNKVEASNLFLQDM